MKTIGERIRQAREAKGWSGETLAKKVGYKTQSGISNLESRASGSGGNKIARIAEVLDVPLDWIMKGPDDSVVPFMSTMMEVLDSASEQLAQEQQPVYRLPGTRPDKQTDSLMNLWAQLDTDGKNDALTLLRGFVAGRRPHKDGHASKMAG